MIESLMILKNHSMEAYLFVKGKYSQYSLVQGKEQVIVYYIHISFNFLDYTCILIYVREEIFQNIIT